MQLWNRMASGTYLPPGVSRVGFLRPVGVEAESFWCEANCGPVAHRWDELPARREEGPNVPHKNLERLTRQRYCTIRTILEQEAGPGRHTIQSNYCCRNQLCQHARH